MIGISYVVSFAPTDCRFLAIGCHNNLVYVFSILDDDDDGQTLRKYKSGYLAVSI